MNSNFDVTKAVTKINTDLAAKQLPLLNEERGAFFIERGPYVCCQVRAHRPRKGRGRRPAGETMVVGYGFAKYNPNDRELGMRPSPVIGKQVALRRAVTDMIRTYRKETQAS